MRWRIRRMARDPPTRPDQKDEDVWTDGPLIGCFENGAAVLEIRPARVDQRKRK
jgi:hypothetical protein